jgi:hypothetical protein
LPAVASGCSRARSRLSARTGVSRSWRIGWDVARLVLLGRMPDVLSRLSRLAWH